MCEKRMFSLYKLSCKNVLRIDLKDNTDVGESQLVQSRVSHTLIYIVSCQNINFAVLPQHFYNLSFYFSFFLF